MTSSPPGSPEALAADLQSALALHQQGRLAEATQAYRAILQRHPGQPDALHLLGVAALQQGDAATAIDCISAALAAAPDNTGFLLNHALALRSAGRLEEALACHDRALALDPGLVAAQLGRGALLKQMGRAAEAVAAYEEAIARQPALAEAHFNLGNLHREQGRIDAAAACYARAAELKPGFVQALVNLAAARVQQGEAEPALQAAAAALAIAPDLAAAHVVQGDALLLAACAGEALSAYASALRLAPALVDALVGRGKAEYALTRDHDAEATLEEAVARAPDHAEAWLFLGRVRSKRHQPEAALTAYDRALALQPDNAEIWYYKGNLLSQMTRVEEAVDCLQQARRLRPDRAFLEGELHATRMYLCDWQEFEATRERLTAAVATGEMAILPFAAQSLVDSPALLQAISHAAVRTMRWPGPLPAPFAAPAPGARLRLGYFSADFRSHAVAQLTAGLFEHHDRGAFEVIGFAFGPRADDAMRRRLEQGFDRLLDVGHLGDEAIARLARDECIDIAIDLGGYTQHSRSGIFAWRAAPVQVSYIGFLGTLGAPWMDYLIADPVLIPPAQRACYDEKIAWLPWYQANDTTRQPSDRVFSRAELGLPEAGIVFASFNNHYKIIPAVFDSWMRILHRVPGSVLYLLVGPEAARTRLRAEAEARGIPGHRVVFADRLPPADYLARYRVADLFLDTWPCNAGTTASDALLMGVPVLTCQGQSMVARMASSVLAAMDLPELVTTSMADYEALAVALAQDPARLAALRQKVVDQRAQAPLFDIARFTGRLEAAFRAMHARRVAGLPPEDLTVER